MQVEKITNPFDENTRLPVCFIKGETFRQLRDNSFPNEVAATVYVNGEVVTDLDLVPKHLDKIVMIPVLAGGESGKQIMRMVAMIIIAYYTGGAAGLGWMTAEAGLGAALAFGAVMVGAGMLINTVMPPAKPSSDVPDYDSDITQSHGWYPQTTQRQGFPVPKYYGKMLIQGNVLTTWMQVHQDRDINVAPAITGVTPATPAVITTGIKHGFVTGDIIHIRDVVGMVELNDGTYKVDYIGAKSFSLDSVVDGSDIDSSGFSAYTEGGIIERADNQQQMLYALIALTSGPIKSISDIKLNETSVDNMVGVSLEKRFGLLNQTVLKHFKKTRLHQSMALNSKEAGIIAQQKTLTRFMDDLVVSIDFPRGIHNSAGGNYELDFMVEYREYPFGSWTTLFNGFIKDNREESLGFDMSIRPDNIDRGNKYEIRVTKTDEDKSLLFGDGIQLSGLQEVFDKEFIYPKLALMGVRALATGQLSGSLRFSCMIEGAIVQVYQDHSDLVEGISKASSAVITLTGHSFSTGDYVLFKSVKGMTEINNRMGRITATAANTITVNIDSTNFTTYISGGIVYKFNLEYSNNPAWVLWDILTQPVISGGEDGSAKFDANDLEEDNLVGWWKMDENTTNAIVADEINGNNGELQSGGNPDNTNDHDQTGYIDGALELDGVDDRIVLPEYPAASELDLTGDLTISCHIYPTQLANILLDNRWIEVSDKEHGFLFFTDDAGRLGWASGDNTNKDKETSCVSDDTINLNEWNYLAVVKTGRILNFYINGVHAGTGLIDSDKVIDYLTGTTQRWIGTSSGFKPYSGDFLFGNKRWAKLYIDNLKIWDVALTWEQIQEKHGKNVYDVVEYKGFEPSRLDLVKFMEWAEWNDDIIADPEYEFYISNITKATQAHVLTTGIHNFEVDDILVFNDIQGMVEIADRTIATIIEIVDGYEVVIDLDTSGYSTFQVAAKLLLHFDGEDAATATIDSSPYSRNVSLESGANLETAVKKYGTASLELDGANDYAKNADADWLSGLFSSLTSDWTIDFWVKHDDHIGGEYYLRFFEDNNSRFEFRHNHGTGIHFDARIDGLADLHLVGTEITDTAWHHIALCKVSNRWGLYVDGVLDDAEDQGSTDTTIGDLYIGAITGGGNEFAGNLDEIRIVDHNIFGADPTDGLNTITVPTGQQDDTSKVAVVEKRHEFNGGFDQDQSLWDAALRVCEIGRAIAVWNGINLTLAIEKPETPVQVFTVGNIIKDSFKEIYLPSKDRASEIEIHFRDKDRNYQRSPLTFFNKNIDNPTSKVSVDLFGITSAKQAKRFGEFRLGQNQYLIRTIEFETEVEAIASTIGDVVYVQHDVPNWGAIGSGSDNYSGGGRIVSVDLAGGDDIITIDCDLENALDGDKTYELMIRLADDTIETLEVQSVSGNIVTVVGSFSGSPAKDDVWAMGEQNIVAKLFRIESIGKSGEQRCKITAIEYNESIYTEQIYS